MKSDQEHVLRLEWLSPFTRGAFWPGARPGGWQIYPNGSFLGELGKRKIERHYTVVELEEDAAFAKR